MAAHVWSCLPVAPRLRGSRTRTFFRAIRTLLTTVRGRQHPSCKLLYARELLSYPQTSNPPQHQETIGVDDAEIFVAP